MDEVQLQGRKYEIDNAQFMECPPKLPRMTPHVSQLTPQISRVHAFSRSLVPSLVSLSR